MIVAVLFVASILIDLTLASHHDLIKTDESSNVPSPYEVSKNLDKQSESLDRNWEGTKYLKPSSRYHCTNTNVCFSFPFAMEQALSHLCAPRSRPMLALSLLFQYVSAWMQI